MTENVQSANMGNSVCALLRVYPSICFSLTFLSLKRLKILVSWLISSHPFIPSPPFRWLTIMLSPRTSQLRSMRARQVWLKSETDRKCVSTWNSFNCRYQLDNCFLTPLRQSLVFRKFHFPRWSQSPDSQKYAARGVHGHSGGLASAQGDKHLWTDCGSPIISTTRWGQILRYIWSYVV